MAMAQRIQQGFCDDLVEQPFAQYGAEDHRIWRTLFERQSALVKGRAAQAFVAGVGRLQMAADGVPRFDRLSTELARATNWQIVAVNGLMSDRAFFALLAARKFPVTWWIRTEQQLDYLQEPDVFHDIFGHVPLLTDPVFADYMQAFGIGGLKALQLGALDKLARLYWYTVEFGLIREAQGLRAYGAGILSSKGETQYSLESAAPNRLGFDLLRIMRTRYRIDSFQKSYFVIDSFDELFDATRPDFTPYYAQLKSLPEIGAGEVLASDRVLQRGNGEGWAKDGDIA